MAHTVAYMSMLNGVCAKPGQCTAECQAQIEEVRVKCAGIYFNDTDPVTGEVITSSFAQKSLEAMQTLGPPDCDYRRRCDDDETCNFLQQGTLAQTLPLGLSECVSVHEGSSPLEVEVTWHSCEGICRPPLSWRMRRRRKKGSEQSSHQ